MTKKIRDSWKTFYTRGLTPEGISLSVASGLISGLFPVPGTTTLLCLTVSRLLRVNVPIAQAVNWLAAPLQLLLMIPFMKFGALLLGLDGSVLSGAVVARISGEGLIPLLKEFGVLLLAGSLTWIIVATPLFLMAFGIVRIGMSIVRRMSPAVHSLRS